MHALSTANLNTNQRMSLIPSSVGSSFGRPSGAGFGGFMQDPLADPLFAGAGFNALAPYVAPDLSLYDISPFNETALRCNIIEV
jgi:hypothetical protein